MEGKIRSMTGTVVALALAGAAGTLARFTLSSFVQRIAGNAFPWGTLAVNLTGCFLYGLLLALAERRLHLDPHIRNVVFIGFMGAFTTFSSLISDTGHMAREGVFVAAGHLIAHNTLGLGVFFLGARLGSL
jgi:CrcB protein